MSSGLQPVHPRSLATEAKFLRCPFPVFPRTDELVQSFSAPVRMSSGSYGVLSIFIMRVALVLTWMAKTEVYRAADASA